MKRLIVAIVALVLGVPSAFGYWQTRGSAYNQVSGGFTPSCTESSNFLARTSGLNTPHKTAYDTMICGLVTDGVWAQLDGLYIFATIDTATANLNLVSSSFGLTQTGTITFTTDQGYSNSAAASSLDGGFNPTTAPSPKWARDSAHFAWWKLSATNTAAPTWRANVSVNSIYPRYTDGNLYCDINASSDDGTGVAVATTAAGMASCSRNASTGYTYYKNGVSLGTRTNTSAAVPSAVFTFLQGPDSNLEGSGLSYGAGLTGPQMLALYNRTHAYMQAIAGAP